MCICFVLINNIPSKFPFRICLASNRDEYFTRPSAPLQRWPSPNHHIIGGRDLTPGKENGTWAAVNSLNGKIAFLLNVRNRQPLLPDTAPERRGRGGLVPDFLRSPHSVADFARDLSLRGQEYDPFLLLMLEPNGTSGAYEGHYLINVDSQHKVFKSDNEAKAFVFSNSHPDKPFLKASSGLKLFETILSNYEGMPRLSDNSREKLQSSLFELLSTETQFFPDPALIESFPENFPQMFLERVSSINVVAHEKEYGTRAQTVMLLDFEGSMQVVEKDTLPDQYRRPRLSGTANELGQQEGLERTIRMSFPLLSAPVAS
ncbi:hypothetical protein RvY_08393 [Ramazzottius varieornatus]|uniref:Transport and Golgi organization protein 2 homolog n=1 Tax=Ramazzottius varieornatus TaxID=947166 RepID=A0A1D1V7Z8_RAMVA|nr:hypothetical protein RvY_08393 [Ramazzottius varieornatus]